MTKVLGFDSRYWNGILPDGTDYKFVGIKISESTWFIPVEPQLQWKRANSKYGLLRMPFHFWRGPAWWQDPKAHGKAQAQFMYDTISTHFLGEYGELPPVIDVEDPDAPIGHRSIQSIKAFCLKCEELWGKRPVIYTAGWWWDKWVKPYYDPEDYGGWNAYAYDLWEADPPPDTPVGEWDYSEIIQTKLSFDKDGFNAPIDEDETTQEWIDSVIVVEPDPEMYTQEEVDLMLEAQAEQLEAVCILREEAAMVKGWNTALKLVQMHAENSLK